MFQTHSVSSLYLYRGNDLPLLPLAPARLPLQLLHLLFKVSDPPIPGLCQVLQLVNTLQSRVDSPHQLEHLLVLFLDCFLQSYELRLPSRRLPAKRRQVFVHPLQDLHALLTLGVDPRF